MSPAVKQFFSAFWGMIIAVGLSAAIFITLLMFNICVTPECLGLLLVPVPPVLFFWRLFKRWGLVRSVILGLISSVFLLINGILVWAGSNPVNSIWILLGIIFVLFWLWMFFRIIAALFQAFVNFLVFLGQVPYGLAIVFLFIKTYPSVAATIAANLMPLAGVIFYGWDPFAVLFIYWIQTGIIGYFSLLKIKKVCEQEPPERNLKVIAFAVQKGRRARPTKEIIREYKGVLLFGMISSMVLLIFFTGYASKKTVDWDILYYAFPAIGASISGSFLVILLGSFSFFVNHGYSYLSNFLGKKEYLHSNLEQELTFPVERVGSIWAAIFIAITVLGFIPHLLAVIVSLVFFKIMMDVYAHIKEHGRFILPPVAGVKGREEGDNGGDNFVVSENSKI